MDLFKILMLEGKINEAVKVTRQMDDPTLIEKMRYMAKWKGVDTGKPEDEMEAFRCITNLRKASDEIDKNLIYAVNCRQLTGEPSYVLKHINMPWIWQFRWIQPEKVLEGGAVF